MRWLAALILLAGCPMTGTYLGARTPPAGTTTAGVVFRFAGARNVIPFPQVDVTLAHSPTDDLSVHLRGMLTTLGGEATVRWRFVRASRYHLALAPSFAAALWRASSGSEYDGTAMSGPLSVNILGRVAVLGTVHFDDVDVNAAAFGGASRILAGGEPPGDAWPYATFFYEMQGVVSLAGAALGVGFPAYESEPRATFEWARFLDRHVRAGAEDPPFRPQNVWTLNVGFDI